MVTPSKMKRRPGARGETVVTDVLVAARDELAAVGYRGLRMEAVAARAKVHKTTVYRRWSTKQSLVRDTFAAMFSDFDNQPSELTGDLRSDLVSVALGFLDFLESKNGRCLVQMMALGGGAEKPLRTLVAEMVASEEALPRRIIAAAVAGGQIEDAITGDLLMSCLIGGMQHEFLTRGSRPSRDRIERQIDLLLIGALSTAPQKG